MQINLFTENGCSYTISPIDNATLTLTPLDNTGAVVGKEIKARKTLSFVAISDYYSVTGGEYTITLQSERGASQTANSSDSNAGNGSLQEIEYISDLSSGYELEAGKVYIIETGNYNLSNLVFHTDINTFATCELGIIATAETAITFPDNWRTVEDCYLITEGGDDDLQEIRYTVRVENIRGLERYLLNMTYAYPLPASN